MSCAPGKSSARSSNGARGRVCCAHPPTAVLVRVPRLLRPAMHGCAWIDLTASATSPPRAHARRLQPSRPRRLTGCAASAERASASPRPQVTGKGAAKEKRPPRHRSEDMTTRPIALDGSPGIGQKGASGKFCEDWNPPQCSQRS